MQSGTLHWRLAAIAMLFPVFIGGCALPAPTDSKTLEYRRSDEALRAVDEYETFRQACRTAGGVVFVNSNGGRARPALPDLSTARCVSMSRPLR